MTRIITVVTPVHPQNAPFLREAYESIRAQVLPAGWDWQWVVQEDGDSGLVESALPEDPRISFGTVRASGPAVTRTTALARAAGELIRNLDSDDRLLPGALFRDIELLAGAPEIDWTASRALDLLPDGSTRGHEANDLPEGVIERGAVLRTWEEQGWILPLVPGTLCMRRRLLLALGGWMALDTSEDTGLVIAANAVADGYFIGEPSMLYRRHPHQTTAQEFHTDARRRQRKRSLIIERAQALASLGNGPLRP
ncbi:glycosyltransferase [Actinoallomurus spadix]|uniref:Glycosyltransferase family 2 protein n=1 Tax=Actinoallomurus spadix TaxID=79912 RepID=A0ABP3FXP8_9ACTN|nr:glycosyltransferase [Actinoallomurus spadix]MCO5986267.1 glycosyltransferase [Actinoallomurus spadix]